MPTTIQISNQTRQLLEILKEKQNAKSLDIIIKSMAEEKTKIPKSMFGAYKNLKSWNKEKDRIKLGDE